MDKFSVMLLHISDKLDHRELESMKFLCQGEIHKKKMETITSPVHLFRQLKELMLISENDLNFLVTLLDTIKRPDLVQEAEIYQGKRKSGDESGERDPLDQAFDIICDNVGKDWRRLIRTLGVTETTIDQVIYANPNNMREQLMQSLLEWRKTKKENASVSALVQALDSCRMRLVSERLTEAINLNHKSS